MKVTLRIHNFTPDRENYRKETISEPKIEKISKKQQTTNASEGESYSTQLVEIKRIEPVYEFPKENMDDYLAVKTRIKLLGCLSKIRTYFDPYTDVDAGGVKGLKGPFENAWNVRILSIKNGGQVIPMGYTKRFQYKGMSGGMGTDRFDLLPVFTVVAEISNPPIEARAKNIFNKVIEYLAYAPLGRSGEIEIVTLPTTTPD